MTSGTIPSEEIWKDCDRFPKYQVSNLGNVRNKKTKRLITPQQSEEGYMRVGLYKDHSNRVNVYVHRLVAEAFLDSRGGEYGRGPCFRKQSR